MTVTGFWFAIEDATLENGCLWAAPGGHRRPACARCSSGPGAMTDHDGTEFEQLDPTPLPTAPGELVPLPVPAGTLVVLHGLLPHWSGPNTLAAEPPRLLGPLHVGGRRLPGVELAAAACGHAAPRRLDTVAAS